MNVLIAVWTPLFQNACRPYSHLPCLTTNGTQKSAVFVAAYSALMDFFLSFLPWKLIWPLHLITKDRLGICIAMSRGIFAGATGILKIYHLLQFNPHENEQVYILDRTGGLFIWESAEIAATIIAASIPMLRKIACHRNRGTYALDCHENRTRAMRSAFERQLRIAGLQSGDNKSDEINQELTSLHHSHV
ncbi:hypothetical protein CLIM01_14538 [Colletotrichum limetticola]|uniref:Rhodopsin domain-containing protein n=1 Tax=Colletotrichum limetticola TaxID=1209924 RepID=A0ABQ9P7L7_9PEZI|nr:hypothetical protein CLIM01_14538 [Colletotrichum limetticola]